ncbi:hypothetical protein BaRGS_00038049 [Batillaria attramentaria]|uniref:Uncharacterized protein n=1 Tax=Batillaria attramentaria TaxID=370345 RepID=A0ABD0J796_9CAEN
MLSSLVAAFLLAVCRKDCTARNIASTVWQLFAACSAGPSSPEHRLFKRLFDNYSSEARPVTNASHQVTVRFAVSLNQLLDLDEKNQILTTSVWIYEAWRDENLVWKPKHYSGQRVLMIPSTYIWLPDIFIFNIAGDSIDGFVNVTGSKVAVQNNGHVRWMVPLIVNSACAVDVTYFPYDEQICEVKFGSWIYDLGQIDLRLTLDRPDLQHYIMNSEYDLVNVSLNREVLDSSCCPGDGHHAMVNLKIHLRRKSLYYDYIVIAPTIMLCVLTLASFLLPCHKGEKIAIGLTVFLTLYVLQLRIADNVPDTNSTPILGVFLFVVMTFNCISLIMATIVMNIKKRGDEKHCPDVPSWLLWICHHVLSRVVCTRYLWKDDILIPEKSDDADDNDTDNLEHNCIDSVYRQAFNRNYSAVSTSDVMYYPVTSGTSSSQQLLPSNTPPGDLSSTVRRRRKRAGLRTRGTVEGIVHPREATADDRVTAPGERMFHMKRQWFFVAEVVDKFAFLIYLVTMSVTIFMILYVVPVYMRHDPE